MFTGMGNRGIAPDRGRNDKIIFCIYLLLYLFQIDLVPTWMTQEGTVMFKQEKNGKETWRDETHLRNIFKTELFMDFLLSIFCIPLL